MVDFAYVTCPACRRRFMVHLEFFRLPAAYCHCPYCASEFAAADSPETSAGRAGPWAAAPRGERAM